MSRKTLIFIGMIIGSGVGGYVATWLGAGTLSFTSLIASTIGGLLGICIAYRLAN